jgi:hypothetical protein
VDGPATLSEELSEQFTRMLQEANVAALNSGAYFSGAIALLGGPQLIVVSIGHVNVWRWRQGTLSICTEPTLLRIPGQTADMPVLTGALGAGFAVNKVQRCVRRLEPEDMAVIAMQGFLADVTNSNGENHLNDVSSPTTLLSRPMDTAFTRRPPLLRVIRSR